MRASDAGTAGSISVWWKRTATPISVRCADDSDRVGYALDASPSRPLLSTPPNSSRRRYRGGSAAASTHRCEPTGPLPGRSAGDQAAPAPDGRLVGVRAGGAGSVGSSSVRGKTTAAAMSAGYVCGSDCGGAVGDHTPSFPSVLRFPTGRRRYRSSPPCVLGSPHYLLPPSLALRDTSRVLSFPVLLARSSAVCRSTPRGAGGSPRNMTGRHHWDGLPRSKPHPQFRRRRGKTPMATTPTRILVFIRLTLLRRLRRRELMGELSNSEHRHFLGLQSGAPT